MTGDQVHTVTVKVEDQDGAATMTFHHAVGFQLSMTRGRDAGAGNLVDCVATWRAAPDAEGVFFYDEDTGVRVVLS